jgi:hypothetical protein
LDVRSPETSARSAIAMWESRTCAKAATAQRTTPPVRRPRARLVVPRCSQIPLDQ